MAATLEGYLRQARGQKVKLTFRNTTNAKGEPLVRCEVKALGKRPYAFRLSGDHIITTEDVRKERVLPKKSASKQKIEAGVKAAVN